VSSSITWLYQNNAAPFLGKYTRLALSQWLLRFRRCFSSRMIFYKNETTTGHLLILNLSLCS
jgi:hypothetical protein